MEYPNSTDQGAARVDRPSSYRRAGATTTYQTRASSRYPLERIHSLARRSNSIAKIELFVIHRFSIIDLTHH